MHDRKHDLNAREGGASPQDHSGERKVNLSAKSLAGRGDAPDGSEDVGARAPEPSPGEGDEPGGA